MANALLDTGPVVALINRADAHHQRAIEFFQRFRGQLWSTEAILTEVAYVLAPSLSHQTAALTWLQRGVDAGFLRFMGMNDLARVSTLLAKYGDLPADFADVSLVWLAQQKRLDKVVTIAERDFAVSRSYAGRSFKNLFFDPVVSPTNGDQPRRTRSNTKKTKYQRKLTCAARYAGTKIRRNSA